MSTAIQHEATFESQSLFNLALGKISRSRYADALEHLTEALQIAPGHPAYLSHLGVCLAHAQGEFDQAEICCQQAVDADPADPSLLVQLARVYRLKGDNEGAYAVLLRAHKIDGVNPATASELTRMGIRRPPFVPFLSRGHVVNVYLGMVRAQLERKLLGRRAC